jgi:hypothetical protein
VGRPRERCLGWHAIGDEDLCCGEVEAHGFSLVHQFIKTTKDTKNTKVNMNILVILVTFVVWHFDLIRKASIQFS